MYILLAEDDHNIATIAKLALEHLGGHKVIVAEDGEAALQLALSEKFDVVLLDEMMPKLNGLNVCKEIRRLSTTEVPIIFLSAKSQESDIREFQENALGFIPKPFEPTKLCAQIDALMRGESIEEAA